jgi:hypothetical protein
MALLFNFIGFQAGWFACVYGAANDQAMAGALFALVIVIFHLCTYSNWLSELILINAAVLIGLIWETFILNSTALYYVAHPRDAFWAPFWLVVMWALFATTINVSLIWLRRRWLLSALLGAAFGPLSFIVGENIGAVVFLDQQKTIIILAIGWGILMPVLLWIAERIKKSTFMGDVK